jgi:hypothetical protein
MLKIKGTEIQQALTELMVEAIGPLAAPFDIPFLDGEREHAARATTTRRRSPRTTSTTARRRSTAVRTRSRRTSSRR